MRPQMVESTGVVRIGFSIVLVGLAALDGWRRRVPNAVVLPMLAASLPLNLLRWLAGDLLPVQALLMLAVWTAGLVAWHWHIFGAGDVKLAMALVAWFPDSRLSVALLTTLVAGLPVLLWVRDGRAGFDRLVALAAAAWRGQVPTPEDVCFATARRGRAPATFLISLGGLIYLWWWAPLRAATGG